MLSAARAIVLAGFLFLPPQHGSRVVQASGDTSALEFLGFRPGVHLDELSQRLRSAGRGNLRCQRSKADQRVSECRASIHGLEGEPRVDLWLSAIDSLAGVMTLSCRVDSLQLDSWRGVLEERYGKVATKVQGTQRMLQWVRRGRMIRLTWRMEGKGRVASVSLVDGHVLDNWGRARANSNVEARLPASKAPQPQSRTR